MVTSSPKLSGEAPRETRDCYPVQPPGGPHLNARARRFRQDPHPARVTDGRYPFRRLPGLSHFSPYKLPNYRDLSPIREYPGPRPAREFLAGLQAPSPIPALPGATSAPHHR